MLGSLPRHHRNRAGSGDSSAVRTAPLKFTPLEGAGDARIVARPDFPGAVWMGPCGSDSLWLWMMPLSNKSHQPALTRRTTMIPENARPLSRRELLASGL